jgi:hypothetical protein
MSERSVYKCKKICEVMAGDYDTASDKGVSKKLLKKIIKERGLERQFSRCTTILRTTSVPSSRC